MRQLPYVAEAWRIIRFLLREKPAVIATAPIFALGLGAIYGEDFILGIVALALAAVWGIAAWLLSDELRKRKPQPLRKNPKYLKVKKFKRQRRAYVSWKFSIPVALVAILVLSAWFVNNKREEKILKQYEGFLLPADNPDPPSFCTGANNSLFGGISPDALKIFMGRNEVFSSYFPYVLLRVRGRDRMVIDRDEAGRIALSVDILDAQGKTIVTLEKGHFTVVQANILDMKRPNRSTLVVRDQYKNEVLYAEYLNKKSLVFSGLLRYPEVGVIPISKTSAVNGICIGGAKVAFDVQ